MAKEALMDLIAKKFTEMGLPYQTGQGTDLSLSTELLDAQWGSGKKKISYEASIYADETSLTVFMWEMTKETGSGFSFGAASETTFQSGKTVFRKVKSIQYGPDGKAYEYTLDLGAIPKAVKETASNQGWKFKTVLNKKKALWPEGYSGTKGPSQTDEPKQMTSSPLPPVGGDIFCTQCGHGLFPEDLYCPECGAKKQMAGKPPEKDYRPQTPMDHPIEDLKSSASKKGKSGALFWGLWSFLLLIDLLMFIGGSGLLFMGLAAGVLIGLFGLRNTLSQSKGKLIGAFVGALILTFILFALSVGGNTPKG
jgi:hypothetical protein